MHGYAKNNGALMLALCLVSSAAAGCYSDAEVQIYRDRIDQLQRHLEEREKYEHEMVERCKAAIESIGGTSAPGASPAPAGATAASTSQAAGPIAVFEGNGQTSTQPFTASGPWTLYWSVTGTDGGNNFIEVRDMRGGIVAMALSHEGDGARSSFNPQPGTFYLIVHTDGTWRIEIQQ